MARSLVLEFRNLTRKLTFFCPYVLNTKYMISLKKELQNGAGFLFGRHFYFPVNDVISP